MVVEEGSLPGLGGKLLIAKKTPKTNSKLLKMTRTKMEVAAVEVPTETMVVLMALY